jgi:hypothetical protein
VSPATKASEVVAYWRGLARDHVAAAVAHASDDAQVLLATVVRLSATHPTQRAIFAHLEVGEQTTQSRLLRAGAPSVKRILTDLRLVYVAALRRLNPPLRAETIVAALGHSSRASLGRHVRQRRGCTLATFAESPDRLLGEVCAALRDCRGLAHLRVFPAPRREEP